MRKSFARKLLFLSSLIGLVVTAGTMGYMIIEGWSLLDSLYMTVITLATIGYGETHNLSNFGRVFTIALIVFGTGVVGYGISSLTLMLFQGDLPNYLKRRKMEKIIARMSDHIIVCGLSRTGQYALEELAQSGQAVVVIEREETNALMLEGRDIPYIVGDATDDENLLAAGVGKARAVVTCLTSDADNAFVVVTARNLNRELLIVSKAETESSRNKLLAVGADKVVIPSRLGGTNLANMVVRPETLHFFEHLHSRYPNTFRAELLNAGPAWEGRRLADFVHHKDRRMLVIALEHPGGEIEFNPSPDAMLRDGTAIMVINNFK
ncbi:potassium channel family protein [Paludibacterium paludis]|uniref:Potassium transporter TrkA n=1 Tax=Paludibacterium paludis TaxID=1225769 RepID=A0A918U9D3_9NEIS|nr:potassium channel protein [Paludibacterium paludis]GGY13258.1 potassium transporter TrkA [Paludibacterium paludis]